MYEPQWDCMQDLRSDGKNHTNGTITFQVGHRRYIAQVLDFSLHTPHAVAASPTLVACPYPRSDGLPLQIGQATTARSSRRRAQPLPSHSNNRGIHISSRGVDLRMYGYQLHTKLDRYGLESFDMHEGALRDRHYATALLYSPMEAQRAILCLDGADFNGHRLKVRPDKNTARISSQRESYATGRGATATSLSNSGVSEGGGVPLGSEVSRGPLIVDGSIRGASRRGASSCASASLCMGGSSSSSDA